MIPPFDEQGFLPIGLYDVSLREIRAVLGFTEKRRSLIGGLERYVGLWEHSGFLRYVVIDGSFVTDKPDPNDIDVILAPKPGALVSSRFNDLLKTYCEDDVFTMEAFGIEAFPTASQEDLDRWIDFFSTNKQGRSRGLLRLELAG